MMRRNRLVLAAVVAVPALLVGAAVLVAGVNVWSALLAGGAAACLAALQAASLVQVRRSNRSRAATPGRPKTVAAVPAAPPQVTWQSGIPIPPAELRFMGEDDTRFVAVARELTDVLFAAGMSGTASVLDVGSGYGRLAAGLLAREDFRGTYVGFDILTRHVGWCTDVITAHDERFRFVHVDVVNERYNPSGTVPADELRFPVADATVDVCCLFSVFTHMYRPGIEHYLAEIARTLRPGGIAVTTWLLFDEARLAAVTSDSAAYALVHELADGARSMRSDDPLHAIGYPQGDLEGMAAAAGLVLDRVRRGQWAADEPESPEATFQDVVIFRRP